MTAATAEDATLPLPLRRLLEEFEVADRQLRIEMLIELADRFREVPPHIAVRPFDESHYIARCESQVWAWAEPLTGGGQKYYFAVDNPQGLSARAWAVIIDETLSGQPLEQVAAVPGEIVFKVFGRELSMGRGEGLLGMLDRVRSFAASALAAPEAAAAS